jgi:hypothetical protein
MEIVIFASPVSAFDIVVGNDSGLAVSSTTAFPCDIIPAIEDIMDFHDIKQIRIKGPRLYIEQIAKELETVFDIPVIQA